MSKRVLIISASAGFGHVRSGEALAEAFRSIATVDDIQHLDALQYTSWFYSVLYTMVNTFVVRQLPGLARAVYKSLDSPWQNERLRTHIDRLNARRLVAALEDYQPDLVVCTHFLPAGVISSLRRKRTSKTPRLATVVTDYHVHSVWLTRNVDHYFVAGERSRHRVIGAGVSENRVTATGIPISSAFVRPMDRRKLLQKHGLTSNSLVVLISAGRIGFDGARAVSEVLLSLNRGLQAVILCGNDSLLKQRLKRHVLSAHSGGAVTFRVMGACSEMHEMMAMSDIIIGRPGGLIVTEALASGLPFFMVGRLPGQEGWNARYLADAGAGVLCPDEAVLRRELALVLDQPELLKSLNESALRLARPHAAFDIVRTLLGGAA